MKKGSIKNNFEEMGNIKKKIDFYEIGVLYQNELSKNMLMIQILDNIRVSRDYSYKLQAIKEKKLCY